MTLLRYLEDYVSLNAARLLLSRAGPCLRYIGLEDQSFLCQKHQIQSTK